MSWMLSYANNGYPLILQPSPTKRTLICGIKLVYQIYLGEGQPTPFARYLLIAIAPPTAGVPSRTLQKLQGLKDLHAMQDLLD